ncbi:MAG: DUF962 domain-containing protein [Myxococcaceae bacterium]
MRTLVDQLSQYAAYHRDRRNIATHFVGIPMIMLGIAALLARPSIALGGFPLSPALLVVIGAVVFYFLLDLRYGLTMALVMGATLYTANVIAAQSFGSWLGLSLGLFVVGWVIQFIGHYFEGRKPAFVDDLVGLLVGPLFVVAELGFALGLRTPVLREIEGRVGPTRNTRPAVVPAQQ